MIVTDIEQIDKKKALLRLEGEEPLPLYKGELKKYGIEPSCDISDELYNELVWKLLLHRGKERAMHILAGADKTERQIRDKLKQGFYPEVVIDEIIAFLKKYDYINDYNYAVNYIRSMGSGQSLRLIQNKLRLKGIDDSIIKEAEKEYTQAYDPTEAVMNILSRRNYHHEKADAKERNKMSSYLVRRGFSYEKIVECMRKTP